MNKEKKIIQSYVPAHKNVKLQKKVNEGFEVPPHLQMDKNKSHVKLLLASFYMLKDNFLIILSFIFIFSVLTFISDILINKLFYFNFFNFSNFPKDVGVASVIIAIIGFNLSLLIPAPLFLSLGSIFLRIWDGYGIHFSDIFFGFTKILDSYKIMFFWLAKALLTFLPLYIILIAYSFFNNFLEGVAISFLPPETNPLSIGIIIPFFIILIFTVVRYKKIRIINPLYLVAAFMKADDEYHEFSWREITHVNYLKLKAYAHRLNFFFFLFLIYLILLFYSHTLFINQETLFVQNFKGLATIIAIRLGAYIFLNLFLVVIGTAFAGLYRLNSELDDEDFWLI